jgi:N-acetylneuraminate synthase
MKNMFIYLEAARKCESDAKLVMEWRNDPETLKMFYHSKPKYWDSFYYEYCNEYFKDVDLLPVFALFKGEKVGFLRFNKYKDDKIKGNVADIDINLSPQKRYLGLGAEIIKKGVYYLFNKGYETVVAEIKQINIASIRAFEKAGFLYFDSMDKKIKDTGEIFPIYRFTLHKTKQKNEEEKKHVFIIAEAGSNWRCGTPTRDIKMAKSFIDVAAEAGADAVKFQTYKPETVYVPNAGESDYLSEAGIKKSIIEIFKDLSMPYEMIPQLAEYCEKQNIQFMSTPFSVADAKAVDPYVKTHKIASYEISHIRLIEFIAKTGKPVILSTGGATYEDIEWAINHFYKNGGKTISLMQCTAKYPAPLSTLNLKVIPDLINRFNIPVGLSDHSRDPITGPVGAVALGAEIIEKHFTLHNKLPGPDHSFAITPDELKQMVKAIRQIEQALGSGKKEIQTQERELREYAQRSIQAIKEIKKGDVLSEGRNIDILRPGKQKHGLHPKHLIKIEGKKATRNISLGDGIEEGDYE